MDDQRPDEAQTEEEAPAQTSQAWASVRRIREQIAWALLAISAIGVLVSAGQLLGVVGVPVPVASAVVAVQSQAGTSPVGSPAPRPVLPPTPGAFSIRAAAMGPQFVDFGIIVLPVLAVILVAFAGGLADRARHVVWAAISVEAVALVFGVISWLGARGAHLRPGAWFVFFAADLAFAATALVFLTAVARSEALSPTARLFADLDEEDEDFGPDDDGFEPDDGDFGGGDVDYLEG